MLPGGGKQGNAVHRITNQHSASQGKSARTTQSMAAQVNSMHITTPQLSVRLAGVEPANP
jgi:hypothetical protein